MDARIPIFNHARLQEGRQGHNHMACDDFILPILGALVKEAGFEWGTSSQGCGFPSITTPAAPIQGQGCLQGDKKT